MPNGKEFLALLTELIELRITARGFQTNQLAPKIDNSLQIAEVESQLASYFGGSSSTSEAKTSKLQQFEQSEPVKGKSFTATLCPECQSPMKKRVNRQNGEEFWGCTSYPDCRGTRQI